MIIITCQSLSLLLMKYKRIASDPCMRPRGPKLARVRATIRGGYGADFLSKRRIGKPIFRLYVFSADIHFSSYVHMPKTYFSNIKNYDDKFCAYISMFHACTLNFYEKNNISYTPCKKDNKIS
jgi:hypothetical protein